MSTIRTPQIIIRTLVLFIVGGIVFGYAYYRTLPYRLGPQVELNTPASTFTTDKSPIELSGTTKRINDMHLNGRKIFTDRNGAFTEHVYMHSGYNNITIRASDRFGKYTTQHIEVYYTP